MKKYSFFIILFLMSFALSAQNQAQQGSKLSNLNTEGFTKKQLATLDSIKVPRLSTVDFTPKVYRIEASDTLLIASYMNPVKAELLKDSTHTEHITWDIYTVVCSNKKEVAEFKDKENKQRKENAAKLRAEAARMKEEADKLDKGGE